MITALSFRDAVLSVHIMAVVAAFGVLLAFPVLVGAGRRLGPRGLPLVHRIRRQIIRRLVTPGLVVVIAAGIYLAADLGAFAKFYVQWGFVAALLLGGLAGYLGPREGRLAELAERDLAAGSGALSEEYDALSHQVSSVSALASLLVLATIFVMSVHLGA